MTDDPYKLDFDPNCPWCGGPTTHICDRADADPCDQCLKAHPGECCRCGGPVLYGDLQYPGMPCKGCLEALKGKCWVCECPIPPDSHTGTLCAACWEAGDWKCPGCGRPYPFGPDEIWEYHPLDLCEDCHIPWINMMFTVGRARRMAADPGYAEARGRPALLARLDELDERLAGPKGLKKPAELEARVDELFELLDELKRQKKPAGLDEMDETDVLAELAGLAGLDETDVPLADEDDEDGKSAAQEELDFLIECGGDEDDICEDFGVSPEVARKFMSGELALIDVGEEGEYMIVGPEVARKFMSGELKMIEVGEGDDYMIVDGRGNLRPELMPPTADDEKGSTTIAGAPHPN